MVQTEGMVQREGPTVASSACGLHVASVCSLAALHRTFEFIPGFHLFRLLGLQVGKFLFFFPRVHVMCDLHALHEDSSDGKIQCPTIDAVLCENCAMGEGCVLEVA